MSKALKMISRRAVAHPSCHLGVRWAAGARQRIRTPARPYRPQDAFAAAARDEARHVSRQPLLGRVSV
jgi:hypothetical protein